MRTTFGMLAKIAESSPGYAVVVIDGSAQVELSNIRYQRTPGGRRNTSTVLADYQGRTGIFSSDQEVRLLD